MWPLTSTRSDLIVHPIQIREKYNFRLLRQIGFDLLKLYLLKTSKFKKIMNKQEVKYIIFCFFGKKWLRFKPLIS